MNIVSGVAERVSGRRVGKTLSALLLIVACLAVLAWALLRAFAAWHFFAAQTLSEPLFETGTGEVMVFQESAAHLDAARRYFPDNPDYLDFSGSLSMLRAAQPGVVGGERRDLLESAAVNFRRAISVRPRWPYSWARLLSAKDRLGQVDLEFDTAMKRATETGPWEPQVQLQVLRSGLRHWNSLKSTERERVRQTLLNALKVQPRKTFEITRYYARPDLLCGLQTEHAQINRWCKNNSF
jgi:hypothetical protein